MPWIDRLDARAQTWPHAAYWSYLGVKWYLVITGAIALGGVLLDRMGLWSLY